MLGVLCYRKGDTNMKKFLEEFKQFAMRGNVLDMAVGVILGGAFSTIVTSLVNDLLMPLISTLFRLDDFSGLRVLLVDKGDEAVNVYLNYGNFIQSVVNFIIIALSIFLMIKSINKMHDALVKPMEEEKPAEPVKSDETVLLEKILAKMEEEDK